MSATIPNVYIDEFNQYLRHLAQQEYARLKIKVMNVSSGGENYSFDRVGAQEASQKTQRAQATPVTDYPFSRRTAVAKTFDCGELIEHEDQIQAKVDIKGGLVRAMGMSMARAYDDEIIRAFGDDALDGNGSAVSFPTAQQIDSAGAQISFDLITQVQEKFLENDIQGEVMKCFVIGPAQVRRLLQLTEQTSSDYVTREALQKLSQGLIVPNWMGFCWICSTRLLSPSAGITDCYAFTDRAIGLATNRDISTFVQQDPSRSYAWSLYAQATYGAVRVEDEQIVNLRVTD
ncbi:MAG: hypothetical protein HRU21_09795 [Pseudomonadales bacterium]|nr:hypothetical protein [Pseudomonadales bacterium]